MSIMQPSEILPNIFIGSSYHARRPDILHQLGITHILNVAEEININNNPIFKKLHVKLKDTPEEIINFEEIFVFIDSMSPQDKVLVHCMAGISRSATIVIGYLMRNNKWDTQFAINFVKEKRNMISPNLGFIAQLFKYEQKILGSPTTGEDKLLKEHVESLRGAVESLNRMYVYLRTRKALQESYDRLVTRMKMMSGLLSSGSTLQSEIAESKKLLDEVILPVMERPFPVPMTYDDAGRLVEIDGKPLLVNGEPIKSYLMDYEKGELVLVEYQVWKNKAVKIVQDPPN